MSGFGRVDWSWRLGPVVARRVWKFAQSIVVPDPVCIFIFGVDSFLKPEVGSGPL